MKKFLLQKRSIRLRKYVVIILRARRIRQLLCVHTSSGIIKLTGWKASQPFSGVPTCSYEYLASSSGISVFLCPLPFSAASTRSCAWQVLSRLTNQNAAASTVSPTCLPSACCHAYVAREKREDIR